MVAAKSRRIRLKRAIKVGDTHVQGPRGSCCCCCSTTPASKRCPLLTATQLLHLQLQLRQPQQQQQKSTPATTATVPRQQSRRQHHQQQHQERTAAARSIPVLKYNRPRAHSIPASRLQHRLLAFSMPDRSTLATKKLPATTYFPTLAKKKTPTKHTHG